MPSTGNEKHYLEGLRRDDVAKFVVVLIQTECEDIRSRHVGRVAWR